MCVCQQSTLRHIEGSSVLNNGEDKRWQRETERQRESYSVSHNILVVFLKAIIQVNMLLFFLRIEFYLNVNVST